MNRWRMVGAVAVLVLAGCGGDDDTSGTAGGAANSSEASDSGADDGEDFAAALGAGKGGGSVVIDGTEMSLTGATCLFDGETFDSGAIAEDGTRVFATKSNKLNDANAQILDADNVQWFPKEIQGDESSRDGSTITSPTYTYFNNQNDDTLEASFTIECP